MNSPSLEQNVAMVAGGGRGIGAAISHRLAEAGAAVAVADLEADRAQQVNDEIVAAGGRALAIPTDLLDGDQIDAAVQRTVDELGGLDILVNNAGGMSAYVAFKPVSEWTDAEWDRIRSLNLDYVFKTCRAAIRAMTASGGGSIINIASMSGLRSSPRHAPYGASKAAVISLTQSLAVECGHHGIRVNAVAPGTIDTPQSQALADAGDAASAAALEAMENAAAMVPLGRRGVPRDIAAAVAFLASDEASYITGHTLVVDGGLSLRFPIPLPGSHVSEGSS